MVGSPRLQGPYPPSLPLDGLLHGGGEFLHRAAVIHPRQCVRETVVDGRRDLCPPVHIGDTFAQGTPLQIVFRSALLGPKAFKSRGWLRVASPTRSTLPKSL